MRFAMPEHRVKTTVNEDGSVTIQGLPFRPGERVEVIIRACGGKAAKPYSLRGRSSDATDPFGGVAGKDWESLGEGNRRGSVSADF
jgi:hypothetical protein